MSYSKIILKKQNKFKLGNNIRFNFKLNSYLIYDNITNKIKNDKQLFYAYQSNIAMQFIDNYHYYKTNNKKYLNKKDVHKIANDAAKAFLNIWIY